MKNQVNNYSTALFVVAVLFIIWGAFGILDFKNHTYYGFNTDGHNIIVQVEDNSPAAYAGMKVDDIIKTVNGISWTDKKALAKRDRAKIGDVKEYVIERDGKEHTLQLTLTELTDEDKTLNVISSVVGLLCIFLGVYANNKVKTTLSLIFAVFAIGLGFNFFGDPYFSNDLMSKFISGFISTVILFSFAALANYVLLYPPQSSFLSKKKNQIWFYAPSFGLLVFIWVLIFTQPESSSILNQIIRLLVSIVVGGYFVVALIALILKFAKTKSEERKLYGLNLLLWGAIIGLIPIILVLIIETISPKIILPGADYILYVSFTAIPIFFTMAVLKQNKTVSKEL